MLQAVVGYMITSYIVHLQLVEQLGVPVRESSKAFRGFRVRPAGGHCESENLDLKKNNTFSLRFKGRRTTQAEKNFLAI